MKGITKNWQRALAAAFAGSLLWSQASQADLLIPDTYVNLSGTTSADEPWLAGTVVEDVLTAFSFSAYGGTVSGTVQNRVVLADDGTYDFYWRIFNDENSSGGIYSWRIGGFVTGSYNANYRIDGLGDVAPSSAYLFGVDGGYVNFNFLSEAGGPSLGAGLSSNFFFFDTDATHYDSSAFYDLTNFGQTEISELYTTFAPTSVPEPATVLLLLGGLFGARRLQRRQR